MSGSKFVLLILIVCGVVAVAVTMKDRSDRAASDAPPPEPGSPQSLTKGDTIHGQVRVYVPRGGRYYHRQDCPEIDSLNAVPTPLSEAAALYKPCPVCNPPTEDSGRP